MSHLIHCNSAFVISKASTLVLISLLYLYFIATFLLKYKEGDILGGCQTFISNLSKLCTKNCTTNYVSCQVATYIENDDTRFALTQPCNWNYPTIVSPMYFRQG